MARDVLIQVLGDAASFQRAAGQTTSGLAGIEAQVRRTSDAMNRMNSGYATLFRATSQLNVGLERMATGLRMVGQAFMNVGITMSVFVSLPLQRVISSATSSAINLDDALVRIQKTTGLTGDATAAVIGKTQEFGDTIEGLRKELLTLAQSTRTPIEQLFEMAEVAGQLGLISVPQIMSLVRVAELLASATDLAGRESVEALGRMAIMYGVSMDQIEQWTFRVATTINILENTTAASARQIAVAALEASSAWVLAGGKIEDISAFVATAIAAGLDAEEAGNAFRRATENIISNMELISKATGRSMDQLKAALAEKGITGFMLDLINSLRNIQDEYTRTVAFQKIFEVRGARGAARIAAAYPYFIQNLGTARQEFEAGTSIIAEYERALLSTAGQLQVLRNNLIVAASAIGDVILPVINQFIQIAVPGIQMALEAWARLPDRIKLVSIALAVLPAVLFPVIVVLSSLAFAVGIGVSGIMRMAAGFGVLTASIQPVIAAFGNVATVLALVVLVFGRELAGVLAQGAAILKRTAAEARNWGYGLISSLAAGILDGAALVVNAAAQIAEAIAAFFRAASPPKKGPLRGILEWGAALIDNYLRGFREADFTIIREIGSIIEGAFRALSAKAGQDAARAFAKMIPQIIASQEALVQLIHTFNETGRISDELMARVVDGLKGAKGPVSELIRAYLEYYAIQRRLDDVERRRVDVRRRYREQARAVNALAGLDATERARRMRLIQQQRAAELGSLDEQEEALREQQREAEGRLGTLRGIVDFQQRIDDLLAEQLRSLNRIGRALRSWLDRLEDLQKELRAVLAAQELYRQKGMDIEPLLRDELRIRENIVQLLLQQDSLTEDQKGLLQDNIDRVKELQAILGEAPRIPPFELLPVDAADEIAKFWKQVTGVTEPVRTLAQRLNEGRSAIDWFLTGLRGAEAPIGTAADGMSLLSDQEQRAYDLGRRLYRIYDDLRSTFESVSRPIDQAAASLDRFVGALRAGARDIPISETKLGQLSEAEDQVYRAGQWLRRGLLALHAILTQLLGPTGYLGRAFQFLREAWQAAVAGFRGGEAAAELFRRFGGHLSGVVGWMYRLGTTARQVFGQIAARARDTKWLTQLWQDIQTYAPVALGLFLALFGLIRLMSSPAFQLARAIALIFAGGRWGYVPGMIRRSSLLGKALSLLVGIGGRVRNALGMLGTTLLRLPGFFTLAMGGTLRLIGTLAQLVTGGGRISGFIMRLGGLFMGTGAKFLRFGGIFARVAGMILGPLTSIGLSIGLVIVAALALAGIITGAVMWIAKNFDLVKQKAAEFAQNFLKAAGGSAGLQARLERLWESLKKVFGFFVVLGAILAQFVTYALPNLGTAFGGAFSLILAAVELVVNTLGAFFDLIGKIIEAIQTGNWEPALTALGDLWSTFVDGIKAILSSAVDVIMGLLGGIVSGILGLIDPKLAADFDKWWAGAIDSVKKFFDGALDIVGRFGSWLLEWAGRIVVGFGKAIYGLYTAIKNLFEGDIVGFLSGIGAIIVAALSAGIPLIIEVFGRILAGIFEIFGADGEKVYGFFHGIVEKVIGFFNDLYNNLVGRSILRDLLSGIEEIFGLMLKPIQLLGETIDGIISKGLEIIDRVLGRKDPAQSAKDLAAAWKTAEEAIKLGLAKITTAITTLITLISGREGLEETYTAFASDFLAKCLAMFEALAGGGDSLVTGVKSVSESISGRGGLRERYLDFYSTFISRNTGMITALVGPANSLNAAFNTIKGTIGSTKSKVEDFASTAVQKINDVKNALDSAAPPGLIQLFRSLKGKIEDVIDAIEDIPREITITIRYVTVGSPPGGGGSGGGGGPPEFQYGGLVPFTPGGFLASLAEREPELVIPLSRVEDFIGEASRNVIVNGPLVEVNHPVLTDRRAINDLAKQIAEALGRETTVRLRYGGM